MAEFLSNDTIENITEELNWYCSIGNMANIVYVGGHGSFENGEHYLALTNSPNNPDKTNALSTRTISEILAKSKKNIVLFIDTCFSGIGLTNLDQAINILSVHKTHQSFAVIASSQANTTTFDGVFIEALISLIKYGPKHDKTAWGTNDKYIRLGALVTELRKENVQVLDILINGASELRIIPNYSFRPEEPKKRVYFKLALNLLSSGADKHLHEKSEGFTGRHKILREISKWIRTSSNGIFVVTGGAGVGKSAIIGHLARQSTGDYGYENSQYESILEKGTIKLVVHAHKKTLNQVKLELEKVLNLNKCNILIDALDEAFEDEVVAIAAYLRDISKKTECKYSSWYQAQPNCKI